MTSPPQDCALLCSFREPTRAYCGQNSRRSCPVVHQDTRLFGPPLTAFTPRLTAAAKRKNSSPENLTHLHYNLLDKDSRYEDAGDSDFLWCGRARVAGVRFGLKS